MIEILDSIRVPVSILACVKTLAPLEINLVLCLAGLLVQYGGHLDQIKSLRNSQKGGATSYLDAKNQESKMRKNLGANMQSAHAIWF